MKRYTHTREDYAGRYKVVDDTISTWAVEDTETGTIVDDGLQKMQAQTRADEYNDAELEMPFEGDPIG